MRRRREEWKRSSRMDTSKLTLDRSLIADDASPSTATSFPPLPKTPIGFLLDASAFLGEKVPCLPLHFPVYPSPAISDCGVGIVLVLCAFAYPADCLIRCYSLTGNSSHFGF